MKKSHILGILLLLTVLIVAAGTAFADSNRNFRAHAKGENQVIPVDTQAQGQLILKFSTDGSQLHAKLNVANIENVIGAHLHHAPEGANGPIVLGFIGAPFISNEEAITTNGTIFEGHMTAANLSGPLAGMTLEDLKTEIMAGNIYVNIHTVQNRPGEIRGQVH